MSAARPSLSDGFTDLAPGKVANVVTCLEMRERPAKRFEPEVGNLQLVRRNAPNLSWYRDIFRRVGAPYLWFSRLQLDDAALTAILNDQNVELYVVQADDRELGLMELDFFPGQCELRFFGLTEGAIGKGIGRWLLNRAIERAWSRPIEVFRVRTCTLDHPGALDFYVRAGFRAYKREIEVCDDPRLTGLLPVDAAPHVPIVR
ncbi:MAG: GNAT family N-acetyltransferase [Candidatus Eremiobacteraeota bacterium]|nr:GNAT family N-acetyltransferase [Candidatus Eremiobacteraeota bacterium]MBV8374578.1 GNAT family N-acetyltransferase [Candidatus Eremiobacteraeota bacterium]